MKFLKILFKNKNMQCKNISLQNLSIKTLLNSNINLQELWCTDLIPTIIRTKNCISILDKLIYNFDPLILENVWHCPKELISIYSIKSDINTLLDSIILGNPIDILSVPPSILKLLDDRDRQICKTQRYKKYLSEDYNDWGVSCGEIEIIEDEDGNTISENFIFDGYNNVSIYDGWK